jgi:hypothetical protein
MIVFVGLTRVMFRGAFTHRPERVRQIMALERARGHPEGV